LYKQFKIVLLRIHEQYFIVIVTLWFPAVKDSYHAHKHSS